jgi:hypothetical protein
MSIQFPLTWPAFWRLKGIAINKAQYVVSSTERGGSTLVAQRAYPLWSASIQTSIVIGPDVFRVMAFVDTLRGGLGTVRLEPWPCAPIAYPGGSWSSLTRHIGGAFNGIARAASSPNAYQITIDQLPTAYAATPGDLLSMAFGARRTLHRVAAAAVAANGQVTLSIEPELPRGMTFPRDVRLVQADAVFRIIPPPVITPQNGVIPAMTIQAMIALD